MSHRKERSEKVCLNCGAYIYGRYCHRCGQENIETKTSFWSLVTHFVYDITHFDSRFFSTVKYLLLRPGFLTSEFTKGRRKRYLDPIKMYVFTSAFFFLFFFSFVVKEEVVEVHSPNKSYSVAEAKFAILEKRSAFKKAIGKENTPLAVKSFLAKELVLLDEDTLRLTRDTTRLETLNVYRMSSVGYTSVKEYDSLQQTLPQDRRDRWLERQARRQQLHLTEKYGNDSGVILNVLLKKFLHSFPQILFTSLPIFAWLLWLLYIRRRRQFYYVDHAIFTVHLFSALFILIFIQIAIDKVEDYKYFGWTHYLGIFLLIYLFWYIYRAMKNFYCQRRAKTITKFILLMFASVVVFAVLGIIFFISSVYLI